MNVTSDHLKDLKKLIPAGAVILEAALSSADPQLAVQNALACISQKVDFASFERIGLVAMGKAAVPMAQSAMRWPAARTESGVVVSKAISENAAIQLPSVQILAGNHPVPGIQSIKAAEEILRYLEGFNAEDAVLFLISGGASALVTDPVESINLAEMQGVTSLLLACGASIDEINTVRKHLDRIKGGQLAACAAPAVSISLILSDVLGNRLDVIASGPTVPDPTTFQEALGVLAKYDLTEKVPENVLAHLQSGTQGVTPETPKPGNPLFAQNREMIIGSLEQSMRAARMAAMHQGYQAEMLLPLLIGEARDQGRRLGAFLRGKAREHTAGNPPQCWIAGGETTVTLSGDGQGGRNQELALAAALELDGVTGATLITFATDGEDGHSPAAGALVTGKTCEIARQKGLDPHSFLTGHNSYIFFKEIDSAIVTGSTGTNVNDLVVMLVE